MVDRRRRRSWPIFTLTTRFKTTGYFASTRIAIFFYRTVRTALRTNVDRRLRTVSIDSSFISVQVLYQDVLKLLRSKNIGSTISPKPTQTPKDVTASTYHSPYLSCSIPIELLSIRLTVTSSLQEKPRDPPVLSHQQHLVLPYTQQRSLLGLFRPYMNLSRQ